MSFDPAFLALMPDSLQHQPRTGFDGYGRPVFGATSGPWRCRVQEAKREVARADGSVVTPSATIYVAPVEGQVLRAAPGDSVLLADGSALEVLSSAVVEDGQGPHHTVLQVGPRTGG